MKQIDGRKIIEELIINDIEEPVNVYSYLPGKLKTIPSRKGVKKAFGRAQVFVNGKRVGSSHKLKNGDVVEIVEYLGAVKKVFPLSIKICFEDDFIAVVEKPPGLPTSGNKWKTLQNALPHNIAPSEREDALSIPLTVHRLDAKTHGLIIVAKTTRARIDLGEMFEKREVSKTYVAIVQGKMEGSGDFVSPVDGKSAKTNYSVIRQFEHVKDGINTIVRLSPITGRKHQLRVHLSEAGHPIIGDVKYSDRENVLRSKGLFLSATQLDFTHPVTGELMKIEVDLPAKFKRYIERSQRWFDRVKDED